MLDKLKRLGQTIFVSSDSRAGLARSSFSHPRTLLHSSGPSLAVGVLTQNLLSKLERIHEKPSVIQAETSIMGHVARIHSEKTGVPFVLDLHGVWPAEVAGDPKRESQRVVQYVLGIERQAVQAASHVIVVSNRMKDHLISTYEVSAGKITVMPNGGFIAKRRAVYSPRPALVFGGVFDYYERIQDFLRMSLAREVSDCRLVMLGDGRQKRLVLSMVRRNPAANLTYMGPRSRPDTLEIFARSQVGIAPSSSDLARQVAWPIKVMDYMSCGLPVVAPDVGDWGEMLRKSGAGVITPQSDPHEFALAVSTLKDRQTWINAAKNATETIETQLLWENVLGPLDGLYSEYL